MSNPRNDGLRHRFATHLREGKGQSEKSIDAALRALTEFEVFSHHRDFRMAHPDLVKSFKADLQTRPSLVNGKPLSASTLTHTLRHCKTFFGWLATQPGYRSMDASVVDYFTPPRRIQMQARARLGRPIPTIADIEKMLEASPRGTIIERRNRAIIAFTVLTGMRDNAIASSRIKHVDCDAKTVFQDAAQMRVKFSKTQHTSWFPLGELIEEVVVGWLDEIKGLGFDPEDPLFPKNRALEGSVTRFSLSETDRKCWSNAKPIRDVFRAACAAAGLPYFNPHGVRNTLSRLLRERCPTPEQQKAWSQNLGHERLQTTDQVYGRLDDDRKHELVRGAVGGAAELSDAEVVGLYLLDRPRLSSADQNRALALLTTSDRAASTR